MWVMMAGMMTASVAPMSLLSARVGRQARGRRGVRRHGLACGGLFAAWTALALIAAFAQCRPMQLALLSDLKANSSPGAAAWWQSRPGLCLSPRP